MVIVRVPFRIAFSGGGTDMSDFYKQESGLVVSTAINKYIYVTITKNFEGKVNLRYSDRELVNHAGELKHGIVRECLKMAGIDKGVEIVIISDIPMKGTGLGSSSALTCGLLKALWAYKGGHLVNMELAKRACEVEIDILKAPIGKQDQYGVALGGLNAITFEKDGWVTVDDLEIKSNPDTLNWLKNSLMLFYIGNTNHTNGILKNRRTDEEGFQIRKAMKRLAQDMIEWLKDGVKLETFGEILNLGYVYKMESGCGAVSAEFESAYRLALDAGALGGKPTGANGGFLLLACHEKDKPAVRRALCHLKEVEFEFEKEGAKVIYNG